MPVRSLPAAVTALLLAVAAVATAAPAAAQEEPQTSPPVVVRGTTWLGRDTVSGGTATFAFDYGTHLDVPLWGDWDGDGFAEPAVWRDGSFLLNHQVGGGTADEEVRFGQSGDVPITGDWDADGIADVGVRRGNVFHLDLGHTGGAAERSFAYGRVTDIPLVGDWDGDGIDDVGVRRGNVFYLEAQNPSDGRADLTFGYGRADDVPVVGRWTADATHDQVGVVRGKTWYLTHDLAPGEAEQVFAYGTATDWVATAGAHGQSIIQPQVSYEYTIGVLGPVDGSSLATFGAVARQALNDTRSWTLGREVLFNLVPDAGYEEEFHLWLADPQVVADAAPVCSAQWSCTVGDDVYINEERWEHATETWAHRDLYNYRRYVIVHEVGHWLGLDHRSCPGAGQPAPVMQQQSIALNGCKTNLFPLPDERDALAAIRLR